MRPRRGFTLIEMLVVVAIISLLIALLLPAYRQAKGHARVATCKSQLRQVYTGVHQYMQMFSMPRPWQFANGSGDYPHESGHSATRPGTPARALDLLTGILPNGRLFFCPDIPIDYDTWYDPTPNSSFTKFHGTYAWHYDHIRRVDDPTPSGNSILYLNEASRDVLMVDNSNNSWSTWGFPYRFEHYNALMLQGNVETITYETDEMQYWMWGDERRPYN